MYLRDHCFVVYTDMLNIDMLEVKNLLPVQETYEMQV